MAEPAEMPTLVHEQSGSVSANILQIYANQPVHQHLNELSQSSALS